MCKFRINRHALESSHRINVDFPHGMNIQCGKSTFILCGLSNACLLMRNFHIHSKIFFLRVYFVQASVFKYDIVFFFYSSKDVRLPQQLQRAMAAEAEAAREARAKVSHAITQIASPDGAHLGFEWASPYSVVFIGLGLKDFLTQPQWFHENLQSSIG